MRKFEVGKRYTENGAVEFEIVKRTAKFVTYVMIQHPGKSNERRCDAKKARINEWDNREVFFAGNYQLEA